MSPLPSAPLTTSSPSHIPAPHATSTPPPPTPHNLCPSAHSYCRDAAGALCLSRVLAGPVNSVGAADWLGRERSFHVLCAWEGIQPQLCQAVRGRKEGEEGAEVQGGGGGRRLPWVCLWPQTRLRDRIRAAAAACPSFALKANLKQGPFPTPMLMGGGGGTTGMTGWTLVLDLTKYSIYFEPS